MPYIKIISFVFRMLWRKNVAFNICFLFFHYENYSFFSIIISIIFFYYSFYPDASFMKGNLGN